MYKLITPMSMSVNSKVSTAKILSTTKVTSVTDSLAQRYLALKEQQVAIEAELEEVKEEVKAQVNRDGVLSTSLGDFVLQTRKTLSWSLDTVKDIFGTKWTNFVAPDTKTLKARMEQKDEAARLLEIEAKVAVTEAVTFKKN